MMLSDEQVRSNERRLEEIRTYIAAPARGEQPLPHWIVDDLLAVAENFRADRAERIVDLMAEVGRLRGAVAGLVGACWEVGGELRDRAKFRDKEGDRVMSLRYRRLADTLDAALAAAGAGPSLPTEEL